MKARWSKAAIALLALVSTTWIAAAGATSGLLGQRSSRVSDVECLHVGGGAAEFTSAGGGSACRPQQEEARTQWLQTDRRSRRAPTTLDPRLQVRVGSSALADGTLALGRVLEPDAAARRFPALASLSRALSHAPTELVPTPLWVDVEPTGNVARVEFHALAGSLLIGRGVTELPPSVWLHELGHARMRGARPRGPMARRLLQAIDEGAADYFAACLSGSPRVGDASELRDLTRPPRVGSSEWASLAFPGFDTHRMGWALAARLYAEQPTRGALLSEVITCLDGDSELDRAADSPAAAVQALLAACPGTSRRRLASVLSSWLPAQLSIQEKLP